MGWTVVGVTVLVAAAAAVVVWFTSHGDLAAVRQELRSRGLPTAWSEVGLRTAAPERVRDWQRLVQLAASMKAYRDLPNAYLWPGPRPGVPLPDAVVAHHAACLPADVAEVRRILAAIGPGAIDSQIAGEAPRERARPDVLAIRGLARWYEERIAILAPDAVCGEAIVASELIPLREPPTLLRRAVELADAEGWLRAVAVRLSDLPEPDRAAVAACCDRLAARLLEDGDGFCRAAPFELLEELEAQRPREMLLMSGLASSGGSVWGDARKAFRLRTCRASVVHDLADIAEQVCASRQPTERLVAERRVFLRAQASAAAECWEALAPYLGRMVANESLARQRLLLLAAELRHQPWPADPCDPDGRPFRRYERGGRLVGAYSVGWNGSDDAGQGDDRCLDLYGQCHPLHEASPPSPPSPPGPPGGTPQPPAAAR